MTRVEKAVKIFESPSSCSQAVAAAYADLMGMDEALVHKSMTGFGGGVGGKQLLCGAIAGGVYVLSILYGSEHGEQTEEKAVCRAKVAAYVDAVEARLGSTSCGGILGMNMEEAKANDLFSTKCVDAVRVCSEELDVILS